MSMGMVYALVGAAVAVLFAGMGSSIGVRCQPARRHPA